MSFVKMVWRELIVMGIGIVFLAILLSKTSNNQEMIQENYNRIQENHDRIIDNNIKIDSILVILKEMQSANR